MPPPNGRSGPASGGGRAKPPSPARGDTAAGGRATTQQRPAARVMEGPPAGDTTAQRSGRGLGQSQRKRPARSGQDEASAAASAAHGTRCAPLVQSPAELRAEGRRRARKGPAAAEAPPPAASALPAAEGVMLRKRRRRGAPAAAVAQARPSHGIVLADSANSGTGPVASPRTVRDSVGGEEEEEEDSLFLSVPPPGSHQGREAASAARSVRPATYAAAVRAGGPAARAAPAAAPTGASARAGRPSGAGAATQSALAALAAQQSALAGSEARRDGRAAQHQQPRQTAVVAPQEVTPLSWERRSAVRAPSASRVAPTAARQQRPRAVPFAGVSVGDHVARPAAAPRQGASGSGWRAGAARQWAGGRPGAQKRVVDYAALQSMLR